MKNQFHLRSSEPRILNQYVVYETKVDGMDIYVFHLKI